MSGVDLIDQRSHRSATTSAFEGPSRGSLGRKGIVKEKTFRGCHIVVLEVKGVRWLSLGGKGGGVLVSGSCWCAARTDMM